MSIHSRRVCPGLAIPFCLLLGLTLVPLVFVPAAHGEVVDEATADFGFLEEIATGSGFYGAGPGTPPAGSGSAHFIVDGTGRQIFGTDRFNGTRFDLLTSLTYATYRFDPVDGVLALSLQINTDYDVTDGNFDWQGRLVYEPTNAGLTVLGQTWQTWDTLAGNWWASGSPGNTVCPQGDPCTWAEVLAAFPNAGVHLELGAVLIKAGGPWAGGFWGAADDLRVGVDGAVSDFDFETNSLVFTDGFESGDASLWDDSFP